MQVILGASGQIGHELARELKRGFTSELRLVSRRPRKVNDTDEVLSADLLDAAQTLRAVQGAEIVYLTAGLPMDTKMWVAQWPVIMRNVLDACAAHSAKLVFFDNTYMYPQTSDAQTEQSIFLPYGEKGRVRATIATELLDAIKRGRVQGMICRAPEFYGPGKTQSITNATVLNNLRSGKTAKVFLRDDTLRSLIYSPDASRAMALLGNTPDAYGRTWHLPCDDHRLTYRELIELAARVFKVKARYMVLRGWQLALAGLVNKQARDAAELLPRYRVNNIFVSDKFKSRFPTFQVTPFEQGLTTIRDEAKQPSPTPKGTTTDHAAHLRAESFAFAQDRHTRVYICRHAADGAPVLHVAHEADGDWRFLCGGMHGEDHIPLVVCLEHVVAADPTLNELASMCINHEAQRSAPAQPWTIVDLGEDFIRTSVEKYGWAVQGVAEDKEGPGFSYTVGLHQSFSHPELIVTGLPTEIGGRVLNDLGERIRGGARLHAGQLINEVLGHPVKLHAVRKQQSFKEHMGYALWFYDGRPFELLQVLWPDQHHHFPSDPGAPKSFLQAQPVLP